MSPEDELTYDVQHLISRLTGNDMGDWHDKDTAEMLVRLVRRIAAPAAVAAVATALSTPQTQSAPGCPCGHPKESHGPYGCCNLCPVVCVDGQGRDYADHDFLEVGECRRCGELSA